MTERRFFIEESSKQYSKVSSRNISMGNLCEISMFLKFDSTLSQVSRIAIARAIFKLWSLKTLGCVIKNQVDCNLQSADTAIRHLLKRLIIIDRPGSGFLGSVSSRKVIRLLYRENCATDRVAFLIVEHSTWSSSLSSALHRMP